MNPSTRQGPQQPTLNINPASLPELTCTCGCTIFAPVMQFRKLSALLSPSGQAQLIPVQTMACVKCHELPDEFKVKSTDALVSGK